MPSLTREECKKLLGPAGQCGKCGKVLYKNYCGSCDELFYVCDCPVGIGSPDSHHGHRIYRQDMEFTREQVAALCGGRFPETNGFDWSRVGHFRLEDGVLQPYAFDQILPGPGLKTTVKETGLSDEEWNKAEQVLDMARRLEALHPYFPEETNGDLDRRGPQQGKKPEETEQFRKDFFQLFRVEGYPPNGKWFRFDRPYKLFVRGGTFTNASLLAEFGRRCRSLGIEITVYVEFR